MQKESNARISLAEIPVEPLRKHVERYLAEQGRGFDDGNGSSPFQALVESVWPGDVKNNQRGLYRILSGETERIQFDLADRIICHGLGQPMLWITDPDLYEAYMAAPLHALDATRPTCEAAAQETADTIVSAYETYGTIRGTAAALNLSIARVRAVVGQQETACA